MNCRVLAHRCAKLVCLLAAIGGSQPVPADAQQSQTPTAATTAIVKSDSATVFSEMDASSERTSGLNKGDSVYVDLRMDQGGRSWCGVRPSQQANRIGFVDCKLLQRVGNLAPLATSDTGASTSSSSRGTAAEIPLPPVRAALVLNSSGGLGDGNGPDIVVNQGSLASLNPQQVGIRLKPGELFTFPLRQPSNGQQLPLYAVAAGPGGQVTVVIFPDGDDW